MWLILTFILAFYTQLLRFICYSVMFTVADSITCLENQAVVKLWVWPRCPCLSLPGPPVIGKTPDLHHRHVAVEMGWKVAKAKQGDHELFAAKSILYREAEASGHAQRGGLHLVQRGHRVQTCQHRPYWVPTWRKPGIQKTKSEYEQFLFESYPASVLSWWTGISFCRYLCHFHICSHRESLCLGLFLNPWL